MKPKTYKLKLTLAIILAMLLGAANIQAAEYDLWICGVRVTDDNKDDLVKAINDAGAGTATGRITFHPGDFGNFSYLSFYDQASIEVSGDKHVIYSDLDKLRLTIYNQKATLKSSSSNKATVHLKKLVSFWYSPLEVINTLGNAVYVEGSTDLTVYGQLIARGGKRGISGDGNQATLTVTDDAVVWATGSGEGSITHFKAINLNGTSVSKPAGAKVAQAADGFYAVRNASGAVVKEEVEIIKAYDLWICGTQVTETNKDNLSVISGTNGCTITGTVTFNSNTLTLNGANITIPNSANAIRSDIEGLNIDVQGDNNSVNSDGWATMRFNKSATIKGSGKLNVSHSAAQGWTIYASGSSVLTIDGCTVNATSTGRSITGDDKGTLTINNATVTSNGPNGSITHFAHINLNGCAVSEPAGARINKGAETFNAVRNAAGNIITATVKIVPATVYNLKICGVPVTSLNTNDLSVIPGVTGTASYNPATTTLTLNGAVIEATTNAHAIVSDIEGLKVEVNGTNNVSSSAYSTMRLNKSCTIKGSGTLNVSHSNNGWALYADNSPLTIENCTVNATNGSRGITGNDDGSSTLTINNATVTAFGTGSSITHFADITLNGCMISEPSGAVASKGADNYYAVRNIAGNIITETVKIIPATLYNLWIWGTQVTSTNCGNLGAVAGVTQGTITYDNSTKTLTLNNVKFDKTGDKNIIKSSIAGLIIEVVGENSLKANAYSLIDLNSNSTIQGSGTLNVENSRDDFGINVDGNSITLTIKDCNLNVISPKGGIRGTGSESLVFNNPTVSAKGTSTGSITGFKNVSFIDCFISKPGGALFNPTQKAICYANGDIVKEEVKIGLDIPAQSSCLTFSSANTFKVTPSEVLWNGQLYYSTNKTDWAPFTGTGATAADNGSGEFQLHICGTNNTRINGFSKPGWVIDAAGEVACSGSFEALLDYTKVDAGQHPKMKDYCFENLFKDCAALVSAPPLTATELSTRCYAGMFQNCTGLKAAPALPATKLNSSCYDGMFQNCTSLKAAPALPATKMGDSSYAYMFRGCTSLTQAPELPADSLSNYCYQYMFEGCTSLTQAPVLPVRTLAGSCYEGMFKDCISLTQAPVLPADTLGSACYNSMFEGCTALTQAPVLPAKTLKIRCYNAMFRFCTSLTQAPELPATTLTGNDYELMFDSCIVLTTAPELPATKLGPFSYNYMFKNCKALTQAPVLSADSLAASCYLGMFTNCTSLTTPPALPADTLGWACYAEMFKGCTGLTQAPALPATNLIGWCYESMFKNCTSLTTPPVLPADSLAKSCYREMFKGCTGLTRLPELPATNLVERCYNGMFENCTGIKLHEDGTGQTWGIPNGADASNAGDWNEKMFAGTGGTFTGNPVIGTNYYYNELPGTTNYNLWICGKQVTADNKDNLGSITYADGTVSGNISYNPTTNILTLNGADITVNSGYYGAIYSNIVGMKIELAGNNTITSNTNHPGIAFRQASYNSIEGSGMLTINAPSYNAIFIENVDTLTIKDCKLTVSGEKYGVFGSTAKKLIIDNATVSATGTNNGSIFGISELNLIGCVISKPAGAVFNPTQKAICYANGDIVKEEVKITKDTGTGIDKVNAQAVTLYPNPVRDILHIQAEQAVTALRIYNVHGSLVTQTAGDIREINLTHLPAGIYIVRVETGEGVSMVRVIKE